MATKSKRIPTKRMAVLKEKLKDPSITNSEAARRAFPNLSPSSASMLALRTMKDERVLAILDKHVNKAQDTIVRLLDSDKPDIALRASQDILDRTYGKAIQRNENINKNITVVLGSHNAKIKTHE
jgi:hypothetical protein